MPKLRKDTLYPQRYQLADGRWVEYTPDDVQHLGKRLKEMLSSKVPIPFYLEHSDDEEPIPTRAWDYAADRTRNTIGWVGDGGLSPEGFLETVLEVPDEQDARRLPSVRFVSPQIETDFRDGDGHVWPGLSITHVAATARPIQMRQRPFTEASRLSLTRCKKVRLSLGDTPMADEIEGGKKTEPEKDESPAPPPEMVIPPNREDELAEQAAHMEEANYLAEVLKDLEEDGYHLPSNTNMENFIERLHTACLTKKGNPNTAKVEEEESGVPDPNTQPTEVPQTPIMMSMGRRVLASIKRATAAEVKAKKAENRAKASLSMANTFQARAAKAEQDSLIVRIKALNEKAIIGKPIFDKLMKDATTVKLSLDPATGAVKENSLLAKVQAYEELVDQLSPGEFVAPANHERDRQRLSGTPTEVAHEKPQVEQQLSTAQRISGGRANKDRMLGLSKNNN